MMPDKNGYFGKYGGMFVPETLMPALEELKKEFFAATKDKKFKAELKRFLTEFAGRPTELYYAEKLTKYLNGPKIYLKREDMTHTGSHKINNCVGQGLMALRMGKTYHSRDRGGSTWCCNSYSGGKIRHQVRRFHGRGRLQAPGT